MKALKEFTAARSEAWRRADMVCMTEVCSGWRRYEQLETKIQERERNGL